MIRSRCGTYLLLIKSLLLDFCRSYSTKVLIFTKKIGKQLLSDCGDLAGADSATICHDITQPGVELKGQNKTD